MVEGQTPVKCLLPLLKLKFCAILNFVSTKRFVHTFFPLMGILVNDKSEKNQRLNFYFNFYN